MGKIKDLEILAHNMDTADLWKEVFPSAISTDLGPRWFACVNELHDRIKKMDTLKKSIDKLLASLG